MGSSQPEKPIDTPTEPLVLRPPVGSEVHRDLGLQFRTFFRPGIGYNRHNRFLCHCILSVFLALITALILLLILFVLGFGPLLPVHRPPQNYWGHQSVCRVTIPELHLRVTEMVSSGNSMFNVTILGDNTSLSKSIRILHLCKDGLTVIRTDDRCYIRPMRSDWRRVCSRGPTRLFESGTRLRTAVNAHLSDEIWFSEPLTEVPKLILNSFILALCDGVPALRLVSKPPEGYAMAPPAESSGERTHANDAAVDSDSMEVLSALMSPEPVLPDGIFDRGARYARGAVYNGKSPVTKPLVTDRTVGSQQPYDVAGLCRHLDTVLEDAALATGNESQHVSVVRDRILICQLA